MAKSFASGVLVFLLVILVGVYSSEGSYGVRSWFGAKLLNRPLTPPTRTRGRARRPFAPGSAFAHGVDVRQELGLGGARA